MHQHPRCAILPRLPHAGQDADRHSCLLRAVGVLCGRRVQPAARADPSDQWKHSIHLHNDLRRSNWRMGDRHLHYARPMWLVDPDGTRSLPDGRGRLLAESSSGGHGRRR